jgi:hypothetical protein
MHYFTTNVLFASKPAVLVLLRRDGDMQPIYYELDNKRPFGPRKKGKKVQLYGLSLG